MSDVTVVIYRMKMTVCHRTCHTVKHPQRIGSLQTMYRFVRTLYQEATLLPAPGVIDRVSVQQALWLLVRVSSDLDAKEREDLQELCQASSELASLHTLAQTFGQIVRKREGTGSRTG